MKKLEWIANKFKKSPKHRVMLVGVIAVLVMAFAAFRMVSVKDEVASDENEVIELVDYYELKHDGAVIGNVPTVVSGNQLMERAKESMIDTIGYDPELEFSVAYDKVESKSDSITSEETVLDNLISTMIADIGELKVKAFIMKIGDDFTVTLESKEAMEKVLENAQSAYVMDDSAINVSLVKDEHNSFILVPEVSILQKELSEERVFLTADLLGEPMEDLEADDSEFLEAVVREVVLEQEIVIVETYVDKDSITDIDSATELITKEHEKEKIYTIESGDCASIIAVTNDMSTNELYEMNPGLEANVSRMQIGDELVVMVPEPELFVSTVEEVLYTEIIDREKVYVNDSSEYIGTNTVIKPGEDGILEIRAVVYKTNGKETEREITEEMTLLEPITETLSRGTMALPVTTATGTYELPLLTYTIRSYFGPRWGKMHTGIDLAAPTGTSIKASDGGIVIKSGWNGGYGYMIEIDHGHGMSTRYAHCSELLVEVGDEVAQYEEIGKVGSTGNSTGPHVHFEVRVDGVAKDPMNYLNFN